MTSHRIYGYHPVREALRHRPHEVVRVWRVGRGGKRHAEIEALCGRHRVAFDQAPGALVAELGDAVHNGLVAELRVSAAAAAEGKSGKGADPGLVVLLEDVQDPRNLGALLRVCEGAGVGQVLVRDRGSAPLSPLAVKTSAGAAEWLAIERITNSGQQIERLKGEGFWVYGADASGSAAWDLDLSGPTVLCFGGEAKGLRERTRKLCDGLVAVPMRGHVESLNVATAAAAVLYEAVRQRQRLHGEGKKG
jgi:23S rRNA (guanosine2251-2'-O)-methyltransferase